MRVRTFFKTKSNSRNDADQTHARHGERSSAVGAEVVRNEVEPARGVTGDVNFAGVIVWIAILVFFAREVAQVMSPVPQRGCSTARRRRLSFGAPLTMTAGEELLLPDQSS